MAQQHPLFIKYNRAWLSEVTEYSEGYLCRLNTGGSSLTRAFVKRVCDKLNEREEALFLPESLQIVRKH